MPELIVMGLGELGQLYASAALKRGLRVIPVTRAMRADKALEDTSSDSPLLIAVGEADLESALRSLPKSHLDSLILLQNELFPQQWQRFTARPTVMVPWLLKKKGEPLLVARSTPVWGRHAELVSQLHETLGFAAEVLTTEAALQQAIVDKYAFILTVNALGLLRDITLGDWLKADPSRIDALAREAASLGACLVSDRAVEAPAGAREPATEQGIAMDASAAQVHAGMAAMSNMRAKGRTARDRVQRALENARRFGVGVPELTKVANG